MKKVLFILLGMMVLMLAACGANNNNANNNASNKDAVLSNDNISTITDNLKDTLKSDREEGSTFYVDDVKYNKDYNTLTVRIETHSDDLPTQSDVREYAKGLANYTALSIIDKDFKSRIQTTIKLGDDQYLLLGYAKYNHQDNKPTFEDKDGMDKLNK